MFLFQIFSSILDDSSRTNLNSNVGSILLWQNIPEDLSIHHIVVDDWSRGVDAEQNAVLLSIPTVLTNNLAPPGKHMLHAYTPGTEPFELWEGLDKRSSEYRNLKAERSEVEYLPEIAWVFFFSF